MMVVIALLMFSSLVLSGIGACFMFFQPACNLVRAGGIFRALAPLSGVHSARSFFDIVPR